MQTALSSIGMRRLPFAACAPAVLLAALGLSQLACGGRKRPKANPRPEAGAQPGLFTVPPDQLAHLKITPVREDLLGSGDPHHRHGGLGPGPHHAGHHAGERADHADSGGRRHARQEGRAAAVRLQPRRGQRHRGLSQGPQPRAVQQAHRGPHERDAGSRRGGRQGLRKQRGGLQRRHYRRPEQPAAAAHFRHHRAGDRPGGEAGHRHQHRTGRAVAHFRA